MAVFDALKLLKFNKLYNKTWAPVWSLVKMPPQSGADVVAHLCFVGTLLYAIRYQVGLNVGMDDGFARTLAVIAVSKSGYDKEMEDTIYAVFSVEAGQAAMTYVSALYDGVNRVIAEVRKPGSSGGESLEAMINELKSHYERLEQEVIMTETETTARSLTEADHI